MLDAVHRVERLLPVVSRDHRVSVELEHVLHRLAKIVVVLDQKYRVVHSRSPLTMTEGAALYEAASR